MKAVGNIHRIAPLLIACVLPLSAAEQWLKLTTPHFEMYTTNGQTKAVEALRTFEEARGFFEENSPTKTAPDVPVRIIAFKSDKEYKPYSINQGGAAYYQPGHKRDYIVMQELGPAYNPAAIHEYTHLFIEHIGLKLPLWLNEGLADVYSSLQPNGKKLMVGAPPPGRLENFRAMPPIDLRQLLRITRESSYYQNPQQMSQFYAESWALAHMLFLGKNYRGHFQQFLTAVTTGKGMEESFKEAYQKTLDEVAVDLHRYFFQGTIAVTLFETHLSQKDLEPEVSKPEPLETDLVLADLLSTHAQTAEEAQERLTKLSVDSPHNPDVEESLAYLSWQQGKIEEAEEHFQRALQKGSKDPLMMFQYAGLLHSSQADPAEILKLPEQAVALKPDLYDARFNLGMEAVQQGRCGVAISALGAITNVKPDRAFALFATLAYCDWKLGDPAEARRQGELARQYAQNPQDKARAEQFLQQLDGAGKPPR